MNTYQNKFSEHSLSHRNTTLKTWKTIVFPSDEISIQTLENFSFIMYSHVNYIYHIVVCTACYLMAQSSPTLCYPMDCRAPGFSVLHYLLEFAQIQVHWVGDVIYPSHPLPPPSPFAFNLFHHQFLLQWVSSLHQVAKVLKLELQQQPIRCVFRVAGGGLVTKSCLTLATPWIIAHQALLSMGFSCQEYRSGLLFPSPGHLPNPGIEPRSPALQADSLPIEPWERKGAKSCLTLAIPWTAARQALLFMGFSRQEYWLGLPFPSPRETELSPVRRLWSMS